MDMEFARVSGVERDRAVRTLVLAFTADPFVRWIYPNPNQFLVHFPRRDWDVRALVAHTMGVVMSMGRGACGAELLAGLNAVPFDLDIGAQFRDETDRTLAGVGSSRAGG